MNKHTSVNIETTCSNTCNNANILHKFLKCVHASKEGHSSRTQSKLNNPIHHSLSLCPAVLMSCRIDFNKLIQVGSEQMFPFSPQHFRSRNKNGFFLFLTLTVSFRLLDRCQYLYKMSSWNAEKYFLHCH